MTEGGHPVKIFNIKVHAGSVSIVGEQNVSHTNISQGVLDRLSSEDDVEGTNSITETGSDITIEKEKMLREESASKVEDIDSDMTIEKEKIFRAKSTSKIEDLTHLSGKIVMFNREPLSKSTRVFHGKQQLLAESWRSIAVKLIQYREKNLREISILSKLMHPNIVQIYDAGEYHGAGHWIYIAMELCSQNLQKYFDENRRNPVDTQKAKSFFKQLVDGVAFIHENNIAHRDLKPENILISICKMFIKLSDFGLSKEIPDGQSVASVTSAAAGSEGYRAPEMYREKPNTSPRSDIFPLGIVTYSIFTNGKHPFGSDPYDWSYNIRKNTNRDLSHLPRFENTNERKQLHSLINDMLQHNPLDRPTAVQIQHNAFVKSSEAEALSKAKQAVAMNISPKPKSTKPKQLKQIPKTDSSSTFKLAPARKTNIIDETALVLFDRNSEHLCGFNPGDSSLTKIHMYNDEMKKGSFSTVSLGHYIFVFTSNQSTYRLKLHDQNKIKNSWTRMADMINEHGKWPPAVVSSDVIYMIGGSFPKFSKTVSAYYHSRNAWIKMRDRTAATKNSTLLASQGFIYTFGGKTVEMCQETSRVERLDLSSMTWTQIASMRNPRDCCSASACFEKIFVAGGWSRSKTIPSVEMYDPKVNEWTEMTPMLRGRASFKSYNIGGKLFMVGGSFSSWFIEKYDFVKANWEGVKISGVYISDSVLVKK